MYPQIKYDRVLVNSLPLPKPILAQENTTTSYCYAAQACQWTQHKQALMRVTGKFLFTEEHNNATVSGQELADLFLHVGSELSLMEAMDATEAGMNDLSLLSPPRLSWPAKRRQWTGNGRQKQTGRMTILADSSPGQLLLQWLCGEAPHTVLWNQVKQQGVGLSFRQWAGNNCSESWASHDETCIL